MIIKSIFLFFIGIIFGVLLISPKSTENDFIFLTKGKRQVYLIGMNHVASPSFYKEISNKIQLSNIEKSKALILEEGILNIENKINEKRFKTSLLSNSLKTGRCFQPEITSLFGKISKIRADIKSSELSEESIVFLNDNKYHPKAKEELIDKRDKVLIKFFKFNENKFEIFIIPWGQAHIKGILGELRKEGYKIKKREKIYPLKPIDLILGSFYLKKEICDPL